jgi:hypothetical protein
MKDERILIIGDKNTGKSLLFEDLKRKGYINVVEKESLLSITEIKGIDKIFFFRTTCEKTLDVLGFQKLNLPDNQFIKEDYTKSYDIYKCVKNYQIKNIFGTKIDYKLYKL